jgi:hypothetical protein
MTKSAFFVCTVVSIVLLAATLNSVAAELHHDRDFWRAVAKAHYAVPEHESADALSHELSAMLASPDPELRDDLAYSILAHWIYRPNVLSAPTLLSLTDEWPANLATRLGETETNSVLLRSFSALCLSEMAKREAKVPFMGADRYHALLAEATNYLTTERDLRGYDSQLHWIHSTAHTADLLAALADSALLTKDEAAAILHAIDARLATAPKVYTQGEQDRLASALVSVLRRKDFDTSTFDPWLADLESEDRAVWTATTPESLARYQNHNYLLQALTVRIMLEPDSPQMAKYSQDVLKLLSARAD